MAAFWRRVMLAISPSICPRRGRCRWARGSSLRRLITYPIVLACCCGAENFPWPPA